MPATRLPEYLGLVTELAGRLHVEPRVFANVSKGLVQVCVLPNGSRAHLDDALAALVDVAERLRREATGVRRDPSTAPGWFEPEPGESSALTPEGMKFALDPHNLLNPGLAV
jgi:FAD/FMN-containing dehydrogenase